jgi:hypothetical protein
MTIATTGTGGFSGSADTTGPNAGYDPVMKFRKKLKKKKDIKESKQIPTHTQPTRMLQYKVTIPEVGETVIYAASPAELSRKLRMVIAPQHRADIKLERILPAEAGKFFMDKRMKHMRNVQEQADKQMQAQMTRQQIGLEQQKANDKISQIKLELRKKTAALMKKQRAGGAQATVDK